MEKETNELKEWFTDLCEGAEMDYQNMARNVLKISPTTFSSILNLKKPLPVKALFNLHSRYPISEADMAMLKKYVSF